MRPLIPESRLALSAWLALAVFACYANALNGAFQFDDYNVIVNNLGIHTWQAWMQGFGSGIRPILKFSYTLNWTSGLGVTGFHLTNIAIHFCNVLLVYALTQHFIRQHPRLTDHSFGIPFFTALLFAVHPIHTEAVTYICGRSCALMTFFYLAGLLSYAAGRMRGNSCMVYLATPLCFIAALTVKETAVTFPLGLLAWQMACGGTFKDSLRHQWPNWLVLILGGMLAFWHNGYLSEMERSAALNSLQGNLATQASVFCYLMGQWLLPLWPNIDPDLKVALYSSERILQLTALLATTALMLAVFRRRPWIGFGLAWLLIQLVPLYLFLPRLDVANDRQMYLASWPFALMLVSEAAIRIRQQTMVLAGMILAFTLGGLTVVRNQAYRDEISLWRDTAIQSPNKARVHNNLGYAYMLAGRTDEACREFQTALQLDSDYYLARHNLMHLEREAGAILQAGREDDGKAIR